MRKYIHIASLAFILSVVTNGLFGQSNFKADTSSKPSFKIQIDYLNNYIYNGRADSIASPYQITTASVNFGNGFYSNFIANYLLTPNQRRFDFFELDLGYEYTLGKKVSGELYASKYFYSNQSSLLNGDITSDFGATFNYDLGFLQLNNTADIFFSGKSDFQLMPGVEKSFEFGKENTKWEITPGIYSVLSSLNYYESVLTRNLNRQKGLKSALPVSGNTQSTTTVVDKGFKLLAIECSIPISYQADKWGFQCTPTFAIPYHPIKTVTTNSISLLNGAATSSTIDSTPYSEKYLSNLFYFQIGLSYKF